MKSIPAVIATAVLCAGCGVAETGTAAATIAAAKKQELEQAQAVQQQLQEQIDASMKLQQERLKAVEESAR